VTLGSAGEVRRSAAPNFSAPLLWRRSAAARGVREELRRSAANIPRTRSCLGVRKRTLLALALPQGPPWRRLPVLRRAC
jgi:hypothetical protein